MDEMSRMSDVETEFDVAVVDDASGPAPPIIRSPVPKARSLSDGGTPKLSPSPHIVKSSRRSKDDIAIRDKERDLSSLSALPSTPIRAGFSSRGLSLHVPPRDPASPAQQSSNARPTPLSPKLDHSHIYASPTNILPRRSRGLDFSRAATSLHHSTLAAQASPDSSPTIGSRAMNIPGRRAAEYGGPEQTSTSLWSMMGNQERMHISSSVGSTSHAISDMSSSSDDDDIMDEDMDEAYVTTPQVPRLAMPGNGPGPGAPWMPGSPAANSLLSFQQRQRQRKQPKKKGRGPLLGLGFHSPATPGMMSKSPPNNMIGSKDMGLQARRESISWAANQLHISGNDSDENLNRQIDGVDSPSRPSVVRRPVTRRGNLLPKTKGFARIRAALAEESAPVDAEFRREAEVVRQVRESDMDLEPRHAPPHSAATTALSSPTLATQDSLDDMSEDMMMMDHGGSGLGLTGNFKQQAIKNSKGKVFWDTFSETSSPGAAPHVTPPPPPFSLPRGPSSVLSLEDVTMDSPSASSNGGASQHASNPFVIPSAPTTNSSGHGTPPQPLAANQGGHPAQINNNAPTNITNSGPNPISHNAPPTAAEITRRINSKRRRDDDLDPVSIKRRAVSPGMSVHNSPVMQSPLQRDMAPWGNTGANPGVNVNMSGSRPGSVGGESTGNMSIGGGGGGGVRQGGGSGSGAPSENGSGSGASGSGSGGGNAGHKKGFGRVGFQGMVETNDGITRLSIE